jgi:hypothetical protein
MFAVAPRVEALVRIRCVRCEYAFALIGEPADRIIYRFFFDGLKFKDRIPAVCPSCQFESATIEHADYVVPVAAK